jgi:hypothetical protein
MNKPQITKEELYSGLFNFCLNTNPELESVKNKLTDEEWKNLNHRMFQLTERYSQMFPSTVDSLEYNNAKKLNWWRCLTVAISTFASTTFFTIMIWIINLILGTN